MSSLYDSNVSCVTSVCPVVAVSVVVVASVVASVGLVFVVVSSVLVCSLVLPFLPPRVFGWEMFL